MNNKLSVTIITKNEEDNIQRCLNSVKWADEIVVVDSGSTDKTVDICKLYPNCKVHYIPWQGFGKQKQTAINLTKNDWVLSLDADEEISQELKEDIKRILDNPLANGYKIKRKSYFLNKIINHCGWNNDYTLRLFNRFKGKFNQKLVHESVNIEGNATIINSPIIHYTYPKIEDHVTKMIRYSKLGAMNKKANASIVNALIRGFLKFFKMYFLKLGFLDGKRGFILCFNSGFGVYLKYIYIWEKNNV